MKTGWRKYSLALIGSITAGVLCWYTKLSGAEWVAAQGTILGLHFGANVTDKKLGGAG